MTDLSTFSTWLASATRSAILVVQARVYQARAMNPARRSEANTLLKRITQDATRSAILVVRARVYQARATNPALRSEANTLLKRITQELAARGEYDRRLAA